MSEINALNWGDVDNGAIPQVSESLTPGYDLVIGGLAPVKTGFGLRLLVPLTEAQMEEDPGAFLELTYGQALDLSARLAATLAELGHKN